MCIRTNRLKVQAIGCKHNLTESETFRKYLMRLINRSAARKGEATKEGFLK